MQTQHAYSKLEPVSIVPPERTRYLWKRARQLAVSIGRLAKMTKDIQLYGATKNVYIQKFANAASELLDAERTSQCVLTPKSAFSKAWSVVVILILAYTVIATPYLVAFIEEEGPALVGIGYVVDCLFLLDILVTFFTAFPDSEGVLITNKATIAKNYLKTWFVLDLFACFPFQLLAAQTSGDGSYNRLLRLLRLPRLYRLVRVLRVARLLRGAKSHGWMKAVQRVLKAQRMLFELLKFCLAVVLMVHVVACCWYITALLSNAYSDSWVVRYDYIDSDTFTLYLAAVYWVFTTLTTVGYGDITPYTAEERIFALGLMAIGVALYSYTISKLSTIMANLDTQKQQLESRLTTLQEFAKATKLAPSLKERIRVHLEMNSQLRANKWFTQDELLNELPNTLRSQVCLHMHYKIVERVYYLQDKDPELIAYIVPKLHRLSLPEGDYLYKEHEYPEDVYFLIDGRVSMLAGNQIPFKVYVEGSYFGEVEILEGTTRVCSARVTRHDAALLVLSKSKFLKMLEEFPAVAEEMRRIALIKSKKTQEAKNRVLQPEPSAPFFERSRRRRATQFAPAPNTSPLKEQRKDLLKRERNKRLWLTVLHKKGQPPPVPVESTQAVSPTLPQQEKAQKLQNEEKKGIVRKALQRHPTIAPSKWAMARMKKAEVIQLGRPKYSLLKCDLDIRSPLMTEESPSKEPSLQEFLQLKELKNSLSKHNLRLTMKLSITHESLAKLHTKNTVVASQIEALRDLLDFAVRQETSLLAS